MGFVVGTDDGEVVKVTPQAFVDTVSDPPRPRRGSVARDGLRPQASRARRTVSVVVVRAGVTGGRVGVSTTTGVVTGRDGVVTGRDGAVTGRDGAVRVRPEPQAAPPKLPPVV